MCARVCTQHMRAGTREKLWKYLEIDGVQRTHTHTHFTKQNDRVIDLLKGGDVNLDQ